MSGPLDPATVAEELGSREPVFHPPVDGTARAEWEAMTTPDFWEVGASGSLYSRSDVLDILDRRFSDPEYEPMSGPSVEDSAVRLLQGETWLATHRLRQGDRLTQRASVWRRVGHRWVLLYHQGTVIAPG